MTTRTLITPETKIGDLLSAYPELESVLIAMAPAFEKLKNPILRRTVARVASLAQAAQIAGLDARTLVRRLREAAGTPAGAEEELFATSVTVAGEERPAWLFETTVVAEFDADALLAAGQHPISCIQPRLKTLRVGERVAIRATFDPVPLVDAIRQRGYRIYVERSPDCRTTTSISLGATQV